MSNSRFTQGGQVVHRGKRPALTPILQDGDMPVRVGNIISPAWLAAQMGLPVAEVQERLAAAERSLREDQID